MPNALSAIRPAVLKYLARYTHRVAISNQRLVALKDGEISFRWKDYAHGGRERLMKLGAVEFLRRFLLHVLPRAFVKIRHYGFLANRARTAKLELCRRLLHVEDPGSQIDLATSDVTAPDACSETSLLPCPQCQIGRMRIIYHLEPQRPKLRQDLAYHDSS
jgi:hypothetical protein